jgi:hypothetical protein
VRLIIVGLTAALLSIPATPGAIAAAFGEYKMQSTDFSAAKKKKSKKRASKVEYMRAVPSK